MTRRSRCPPLHARGGHLCSGLLLVLLAAAAVRLPAEDEPYRDFFLLGLGWGSVLPLTPGFAAGAGVEGIESGPLLDDLLQRIFVHRTVADRLSIDIDHDADRLSEGEFLGGENVYSLHWRGREGEALREISVGNLQRSIPGAAFLPIDTGGAESFALTATAQLGPVVLEGLARYGSAVEGRRRFRGSRLSVEVDLADVAYARARFFLLPDAGIDEPGLMVAKSSSNGPILIGGRRYALLARGTEWRLDNAAARLTLRRSLAAGEELAVTYTKSGTRVGAAGLGPQAIIDATGTRVDFFEGPLAWQDYFGTDGATRWLFLKRENLNSYWELRNTFILEDLEQGRIPEQVSVRILRTATLAPNPAYDGLADDLRVSAADATLSFEFADAAGRFYPRPFPGVEPYGSTPVGPDNNPFDPDNPVYGGPSYAPATASATTARVRYLCATDTYRLEAGLIADSVRATVDGKPLPSSSWTVDADAGTITFAPGVVGPQSDIEVVFRWTPFAETGREFLAALGAGVGGERLGGRNLLALTLPIPDAPAPRLGDEQPARLTDSLDAHASFGAVDGERGFAATVAGSGAIALTAADLSGVAIIADMEDDERIGISLSESAWTLAPASTLLPVALGTRGDLRYENLWEELPLGGSALHEVTWDNSENRQFTYLQKAGPYNSADSPPGSSADALVLDVEFPMDSANAWVSASTVLPGIDAGGAQRLTVWLRGVGITGRPLRVYAEALGKVNEKLDDDTEIDRESSAADEGFTITPIGGTTTVIGSNRLGESNGRLDSEDRNGNGVLDAPVADSGVVLPSPASPLAVLSIGTSDWTAVTLDIAGLVAANAGTFRAVRSIRLTVVPDGPTTTAVTGRVLVGGFAFSGSRFLSSSTSLTVHEVAPEDDAYPDLADHPFAGAYPEVYRKLHGGDRYRQDHGVTDKALACEVTALLTADSRALAELPISPPADLAAWKLLKLYVLIPSGNLPPADASFLVSLQSGSDLFEAAVLSTDFRVGWNEVAVLLEKPWTVSVNGVSVEDALEPDANVGVVRRVTSLRFGLKAGPSGIAAPLRFLTDEWHVAEARLTVETAARVEASAGWRGALLSAVGLPLVSDLFLSASYEHRSGAFLGPSGLVEDRWRAGLTTLLGGSLAVSFEAGQAYDRPTKPDRDVKSGLEDGMTDLRSLRLVLDTGSPWVPVIEHRWDRSRSRKGDPVVATTDTQVAAAESKQETVLLSERLENDIGLAQWVSFSRTWTRDASELVNATDGTSLGSTGSRGLREEGGAGLSWSWDGGKVALQATRDRVFGAPHDPDPDDQAWSYFDRLAVLFADPSAALPGAADRTQQSQLSLDVEVPRAEHLGAVFSAKAVYTELNVDAATGSRDVATSDALSLSIPVSPDGGGRILLTPEMSVAFTGTYRGVDSTIDEAELLFAPWPGLLLVPLTWSRMREHEAADPFADDPGVQAASNSVAGRLALRARLTRTEWYLPSRASIALEDETRREGGSRSQKRDLSLSFGKDAAFAKGRSLAFDANGSYTRNFASKVRSLAFSARTSAVLPEVGGGTLSISHASNWTHNRQSLGDDRLSFLPGIDDDPGLVIAPQHDEDTLHNSLAFEFAWIREGTPEEADIRVQRTAHTERLALESTVKWVDPGVASSSVPLRATFKHTTEIDVSDSFTLGFWGTAAAGLERRTGAGADLPLPAIGFEVGVTGRLRF